MKLVCVLTFILNSLLAQCTGLPRMTIGTANYSYSFQIYLNGTKTTFSEGAGWKANVSINGAGGGILKPNTPMTTSNVTTTLSLVQENCNSVLVQWQLVNTGTASRIVGACIFADSFILADSDTWTILPSHDGFHVNGPFYILSPEPFSGIVSGASCSSNAFTLGFSDMMSFNWNNVTLDGGDTKIFQVRYSNYLSSCSAPSSVCADCNQTADQCYEKSNYCWFNSTSSTCTNTSGSPTCNSSTCSNCLSRYDCVNVSSNCEWNAGAHTCGNSSCTGLSCSSCSAEAGCIEKNDHCYFLNSTCYNVSENPTCTGSGCYSCTTQVDCTNTSARSCSWVNSACVFNCTSIPRMTMGNGTYSYSYQVYLNGTKTTFSETTGWQATVLINGVSSSTLSRTAPYTSNNVTTILSVTQENCNTVLVQWQIVNTGIDSRIIGACVYADSYVLTDTDAWTLHEDHTGFNVNGPFYILASEPLSGIVGGSVCTATTYTLGSSSDTISFNWNNKTLAGGETKIFRVRYSNHMIGCTVPGANCQNCSENTAQCFDKNDYCYYVGSTCLSSNGSATCSSSTNCTECLSYYDCVNVGLNCIWDGTTKTCASPPTCDPGDPCSQCENSLDCITAECLWNGTTCAALNCEQHTVQDDCPTTGNASCNITNHCSWNNSVCIDNGCTHNTDCLYAETFCLGQPRCAWNPVLGICYYNGPSSSSNCFNSNTTCSACNSLRLCHGKETHCYWNENSSSCSNSSISASCSVTSPCGSCKAQVECEANTNECKWNSTTMICSIYLCSEEGAPCSACNSSEDECYAKDEHCYHSNGVCQNSSMIPTCTYNTICNVCSSASECTATNVAFGCSWDPVNRTCFSPPCTERSPYYIGSICRVSSEEQCYRNGTTCVTDCGNFVNQTNLTSNGSCAYVQTNCYSRIAENITGTTTKTCGADFSCYYFPDYASYHLSSPYSQCNTTCPTNYQTASEVVNGWTRYYCVPKNCLQRVPNPDCLVPGESGADCILNRGLCSTECPEFTVLQDGDCVPVACSSRTPNTTTFTCGSDSCYFFNQITCLDSCPTNYNNVSEYVNGANRYYCTTKSCDERTPSPSCILLGDLEICYAYSTQGKCYSTCPSPSTTPLSSSQSCEVIQCDFRIPVTLDNEQYCGDGTCYYLPEAVAHNSTPCISACPGNYVPEQQQIYTGYGDATRYHCAAVGSCEARTPINGNNCSLPIDTTNICYYNLDGTCLETCPSHTLGGTIGGIPTCTLVPCTDRTNEVDVHCRTGPSEACYLKGTQCTEQCGTFVDATASLNTGICTYSPTCAAREPFGTPGSETCGGSSIAEIDLPCYFFDGGGFSQSRCSTSCPQSYSSEHDTLPDGSDRYYCQSTAPCEERLPVNNNCSISVDGTNICYSYDNMCTNSCPIHTTPTQTQTYTCSVTPCESRQPSGASNGPCRLGRTDACYLGPSGSTCVTLSCPPTYEANDAGICIVVSNITVGDEESIASALERNGFDVNDHSLIDMLIPQTDAKRVLESVNVSNLHIVFDGFSISSPISILTTTTRGYNSILHNDKVSSISNVNIAIPTTLGVENGELKYIIHSYGSSYTITDVTISCTSSITYTVILVEDPGELTLTNLNLNSITYQSADKPIIHSISSGRLIVSNSDINNSASGESVFLVNHSSSVNVSIFDTKISSASASSPSISINVLGSGSSSLVLLSNIDITTSRISSVTHFSETKKRNAARLECSWTTGVVVLTNVKASIGLSVFTGLTEGTLRVSGGNLTIDESTFTDAVQLGTGYASGSKIGTCSNGGSISITNSYFGSNASLASGTTSLFISTPDAPANTCSITVDGTTPKNPMFIPTLTSAQADVTTKTIILNGTNLYTCTEGGVVDYVIYEESKDTSEKELTYETLTGDSNENTDKTFISSYIMSLGKDGNEKRAGIRYFKSNEITDYVVIDIIGEIDLPPPENNNTSDNSSSDNPSVKKGNTGIIVVVVVVVVIVVIVVVIIVIVVIVLQKRKKSAGFGSGLPYKPPLSREGRVKESKSPKKARSPVRSEPIGRNAEAEEEEEEVEVMVEEEEEEVEDDEEEVEEELEVDDDGSSSEDVKSSDSLV